MSVTLPKSVANSLLFHFNYQLPIVESTTARDKFGGQKAISSDQYFGRNNYDSKAQAEANQRLQSFSGATSISSSQYFGRDESAPQDEEGTPSPSFSVCCIFDIKSRAFPNVDFFFWILLVYLVDQLSADFAAIGNAVMKGADLLNDMLNDMSSHYNY